jgi:diacylglycerol kinase family enzyme
VRLESPGGSVEQRVLQVVAGNGRFFGGGVLVAGGSTLDDGTLVIYTLGARGRLRLLRTVALLRLQFPLDRPGDAFFSVTEALVTTRPARLPVSLDGEVRTETPVRLAVRPGALLVLTPPPADETGPEA